MYAEQSASSEFEALSRRLREANLYRCEWSVVTLSNDNGKVTHGPFETEAEAMNHAEVIIGEWEVDGRGEITRTKNSAMWMVGGRIVCALNVNAIVR